MLTSSQPDHARLAIIGGSGLYKLGLGSASTTHQVKTPFDSTVVVTEEQLEAGPVLFIARHGDEHSIAPHRINYRANLWALQHLGVDRIIAVNTVGGISPGLTAGRLVIPDQIIDYTWGREHTFHDGVFAPLRHIEFTFPYDAMLSRDLFKCAKTVAAEPRQGGVYGCTQGPRLESAAEIERMALDGCDMVGMTAMPEAALARELNIRYASLCVVVNRAAGRGEGAIKHEEIHASMQTATGHIRRILACVCQMQLAR